MAKEIYIGVLSDVPVYEEGEYEYIPFSYANISSFFTHDAGPGDSSWTISQKGINEGIRLVPNNIGDSDSFATITLTAVTNLTNVIIKGAYYINYPDNIYLFVKSSTILSRVSGYSDEAQRWAGNLAAGETIRLWFERDSSSDVPYEEKYTNFSITCDDIDTRVLVGYEQKSVAKKVKRLYRGINGIARKVKKGYIGDKNGLARQFYSAKIKLAYVGTAANSVARGTFYAAAGNNNHIMFGGGEYMSTYHDTVDAYDANLTRTNPTGLSLGRDDLAAAGSNNHILFGGGSPEIIDNGDGTWFVLCCDTVDAYDANLTRTIPAALFHASRYLAAASNGRHILFGGGTYDTTLAYVTAYDENLTRTNPTDLSQASFHLKAASNGNHILFGAGLHGDYTVDVYDSNLTHTTAANLSTASNSTGPTLTAAGNSNHILFCRFGIVDAYDANLTHTTPAQLSPYREDPGAASNDDFIAFGGGQTGVSDGEGTITITSYEIIDTYDANLTRTNPTILSIRRYSLGAAGNSNYILFGGGGGWDGTVVDIYQSVDA